MKKIDVVGSILDIFDLLSGYIGFKVYDYFVELNFKIDDLLNKWTLSK